MERRQGGLTWGDGTRACLTSLSTSLFPNLSYPLFLPCPAPHPTPRLVPSSSKAGALSLSPGVRPPVHGVDFGQMAP